MYTIGSSSAISTFFRWNGELKSRAMALPGRGGPQPAAVRFNDGTADGKPHAHSLRLGAEERLEELVQSLGVNPRARIAYRNDDFSASRRVSTRHPRGHSPRLFIRDYIELTKPRITWLMIRPVPVRCHEEFP